MRPRSRIFAAALALVLMPFAALPALSQAANEPAAPKPAQPAEVQLGRDATKLPEPVQRMRQAILRAATSGEIEALRLPIDMNELPPIFAKERTPDRIAYLKGASADGNGREMLAVLYSLLTTGYAIKNQGTKNEMIVWPYHAALPLDKLTPSQEVEIYRFLSPARLKEMAAAGKYGWYRVEISPDGVWHTFAKDD
ncbi:hypothetical protein KKP04_12650 [Rhodomicrobium sp. Az07]|uniref:hypothetical protein n=1 Tax=Rhodomicrobium sp. Az07 TaxID=2839034 RepID=UPI001BEACCEE|nr:hypothetical protein [Rhodomicrobium sp. Az07]MBT3071713.1 hypothetical protein [Rhodomicrobium sp. Az07]